MRAPIGPQPRPTPQLSPEEEAKADEEQMLALISRIHTDVDALTPQASQASEPSSPRSLRTEPWNQQWWRGRAWS